MTAAFYLPIVLTIVSNVAYHICAKRTDGAINPFLSLSVTYSTACVVCLALLPLSGTLSSGETFRTQLSRLNGASYALGFAIVFLELGFILAYRAGWQISIAALYANVAVGLALLPIGFWYFSEPLSISQSVGLVLAIVSLVLLGR